MDRGQKWPLPGMSQYQILICRLGPRHMFLLLFRPMSCDYHRPHRQK